METGLTRIVNIAKEKPKEKIKSLIGISNEESLAEAQNYMSRKKAEGYTR